MTTPTASPEPDAPTCEWFALCANPAEGLLPHPVLDWVPTCSRCADKINRIDPDAGVVLHRYVSVNEEGEVYDAHATRQAAEQMRDEFPNDAVAVFP
jgi:hypothetical protein